MPLIKSKAFTSGEEGADHEAEADGRYSKDQQEDEYQGGVTMGQNRSVWTHLQNICLEVIKIFYL